MNKYLIVGLVAAIVLSGCNQRTSKAQEAVAAHLTDPESARFKNVEVRDKLVCGMVSGKNALGNFVSYVRFFARDIENGQFAVQMSPDPSPLAEEYEIQEAMKLRGRWYELCTDGVPACRVKFLEPVYPVNDDGTPIENVALHSTKLPAGVLEGPSQLHTNPQSGKRTVCWAGGSCYPVEAAKMSAACSDPLLVTQYMSESI